MTRVALAKKRLRYMSDEEIMDRHVPRAPKFAKITAIPPVLVELAVTEAKDLGHDIKVVMEDIHEAD